MNERTEKNPKKGKSLLLRPPALQKITFICFFFLSFLRSLSSFPCTFSSAGCHAFVYSPRAYYSPLPCIFCLVFRQNVAKRSSEEGGGGLQGELLAQIVSIQNSTRGFSSCLSCLPFDFATDVRENRRVYLFIWNERE